MTRRILCLLTLGLMVGSAKAQGYWPAKDSIPHIEDYVLKRASSADPLGANNDARPIPPGGTLTVLDADGPGMIGHIWMTIASPEQYHLKALVLRIYWDSEVTPSVESPVGDFFGMGLGEYFRYHSAPLSVAPDKAMNSYFPMPYRKHARITITNEGTQKTDALYFNIDYRAYSKPLPAGTIYFHAQYRQASPFKGWTNSWENNATPFTNTKSNIDGANNYVWLDTKGSGYFAGVTMSILQNQGDWWGEGDDMFFIDGETTPSIRGTGAEDYFLGAWSYGDQQTFAYDLSGAPVHGPSAVAGKTSVYRFHLDSPITFTKSLRATIEHGNANHRSDNIFSVAYWYQGEPHGAFPPLPPYQQRIPRLYATGGPGIMPLVEGAQL